MADTPSVKIHFQENTSELTNMFLSGGEIVDFMGKPGELCRDIDENIIEIQELLGQGADGKVFKIRIHGEKSHKKYVVKEMDTQSEVYHPAANLVGHLSLDKYFTKYVKPDYRFTSKKVYTVLNGGDGNSAIGDSVIVPVFSAGCKISANKRFENIVTGESFSVPKNSYICKIGAYSEYIISLFVSDLYKSKKSINFIDMLGFTTCRRDGDEFHQFIFMEKIDTDLSNILRDIDSESLISVIIQISSAVGMLQSFKINHYDLHPGNVFLEKITPETMYDNVKVSKYTHFTCTFNSKTITFPRGKYIAKLGDYGISVKWSTPIIGNLMSVTNGRDYLTPNFYSTKFDLATLLYTVEYSLYSLKNTNEIVDELMEFILNGFSREEMYSIRLQVYRPILERLPYFVSKPGDILTFLLEKLPKIPKNAKILNIGEF